MVWSIYNSSFSFFGFSFGQNTLDATSTYFTVATSTVFDQFLSGDASGRELLMEEFLGEECNDTTNFFLNLGVCLAQIFIPTPSQMVELYDDFSETFFAKVPWGYLNRLIIIFRSDVASTTPPMISGLPLPSVYGSSTTLTIDPIGALGEESFSGEFQTEFLPYWETFWNILFVGWLLAFFLGVRRGSHHKEIHQ